MFGVWLHFISKYVNDIYIFLIQGDPKKILNKSLNSHSFSLIFQDIQVDSMHERLE